MSVTWLANWIGVMASGSVTMAASSMISCKGSMLLTIQSLEASLQVQNTAEENNKVASYG